MKSKRDGRWRGVTTNTRTTFLVGATAGVAVAAVFYLVFSLVDISVLSDEIVSGITLLGVGFAIGGYLAQWKGHRSPMTYFVFGLGIGIVLVAFIGAGAGVSPYIGS